MPSRKDIPFNIEELKAPQASTVHLRIKSPEVVVQRASKQEDDSYVEIMLTVPAFKVNTEVNGVVLEMTTVEAWVLHKALQKRLEY